MSESMTSADRQLLTARQVRNEALVRAQRMRSMATKQADIEYSETVNEIRERCQAALDDAALRHRRAVHPADRAFNQAVIAAERRYADTIRTALGGDGAFIVTAALDTALDTAVALDGDALDSDALDSDALDSDALNGDALNSATKLVVVIND